MINKIILIALCLFIVGCQTTNQETQDNTSEYLGSWPHNPNKDL